MECRTESAHEETVIVTVEAEWCRTESAPEETVIVSVEAEWSVVQSQLLKKPS